MANEKKYERSIELLNNALAEENTASLQYMYFHFICEDKGYRPLAQYFKRTAIQEMKHAEEFAERILFLEGEVKMVLAKGVKHITEVPEMLDYARELEKGIPAALIQFPEMNCFRSSRNTLRTENTAFYFPPILLAIWNEPLIISHTSPP